MGMGRKSVGHVPAMRRVPAMYLIGAILAISAILSFSRISKLRVFNIRRRSESRRPRHSFQFVFAALTSVAAEITHGQCM